MGSLLKEYLNVAQSQDEISIASESNEKVTTMKEDKDISMDNVLDPEESSSHEFEHGKDTSEFSENGKEELTNQLQENRSSEGGSTSELQFKNVVAIVDPPRAGLHPTVSNILFFPLLPYLFFEYGIQCSECTSVVTSFSMSTLNN